MEAVAISPQRLDRIVKLLNLALLGFVLCLIAIKFRLLFLQNINWDEFLYLSKVYESLRGELTGVLQSFYVYFFTWLQYLPGNEVDQIFAARTVMLTLQAATAAFIALIGKRLFGTSEGLLSAIVYLTFTYILDHGTSFRADPIAAFLLTGSLWLIVRDRNHRVEILTAAVLIGLAGMITIKSIFYIPTLAVAALTLRSQAFSKTNIKQLLVLGAVAIVVFATLYLLHKQLLPNGGEYSASEKIGSSSSKVFLAGFNPQAPYLSASLSKDPLQWYIILIGFVLALTALRMPEERRKYAGIAAFILPLATLLFYRNAFPYFYVFIMTVPALLAGVVANRLKLHFTAENPQNYHGVVAGLLGILVIKTAFYFTAENQDQTRAQRQLVGMVHRIFPDPVAYIDRCSMISSYPKEGLFMSTWGVENYREDGTPIMQDLLKESHPVFLLENTPGLMLDHRFINNPYQLLDKDVEVLRDNYIRHWGPIRVAGKALVLEEPGRTYDFELLIPGHYTLETREPVRIDGRQYNPGSVIKLETGTHPIEATEPELTVVLRWGENLYRPTEAPINQPLFTYFL